MQDLLKRAGEVRQPAAGTFELTSRCNLSCRMCYIRRPAGDRECKNEELSGSCWVELAREARDHGMVFLVLTGGEIFLRQDFFEIYEPLTRLGLVLTLFTNGTLITNEAVKRLAQAPPNLIEITLYGATAETYEAVTGVEGGFKRCCEGIDALIRNKVPLLLKTTLTRQNAPELGLMHQMASDWGVPFASSWLLCRRSDGAPAEVDDCRLTISDGVALEFMNHVSLHEPNERSLRVNSPHSDRSFFCHAGRSAFVIGPSGQMNVCPALPLPAALPLTVGFLNAWKQVQAYVDEAPALSKGCAVCDVRDYCDRCPAWSLSETGTLSDAVPYLCQIAHAKKAYLHRVT